MSALKRADYVVGASPIVVVAASRGGLEALFQLCHLLPTNFPVAILVVLHTLPDGPKLAVGILGSKIAMLVSCAYSGEEPQHGHVYHAPPDHHLTLSSDGRMSLNQQPKVHRSRPAANPLFESAAAVHGSHVIGIVLTGGDSDGAEGLRSITSVGGVGVVQSPSEACDPSMPIATMKEDHPHCILPVEEMGPLLMKLVSGNQQVTKRIPS
jgi:two-component system, chemotaxis family, protein-glutamate methylesterase/glutaminase